ncbi:TetR family transcriptional regulator [Dietzia sp. UCD-THP]|nr:TetR family transcriptional regulator [Dietzia sp. UCD-THP]
MLVGGSGMKYGNGREALLAAVVKVVGESGLVGLTNRKVGSAAGVDNSLITYYFGSRDGLLEAATEWATNRSLEQLSILAEARLGTSFAEAVVDLVRADPDLQLFQFEMIIASRRQPQLRPTVERLYDRYIDTFQKMLSLYGYPDRRPLARAIFSSLESLSLQQLTVASPEEVKAAIADLDELLALRAGSPAGAGTSNEDLADGYRGAWVRSPGR